MLFISQIDDFTVKFHNSQGITQVYGKDLVARADAVNRIYISGKYKSTSVLKSCLVSEVSIWDGTEYVVYPDAVQFVSNFNLLMHNQALVDVITTTTTEIPITTTTTQIQTTTTTTEEIITTTTTLVVTTTTTVEPTTTTTTEAFDALAPSALALTVLSDTSIQLDWTNNSTNAEGVSIERSINGTDYAEVDTVLADVATFTDTTLADGTRYYYRLKAYKGVTYSAASTAANDWSAIKMVLTSTGTGAGVSTVWFWFDTTDVVATLDGNGKWYSDAGGTANESASYTFVNGALRTRFLKVTSGVANMLIFAKGNWLRWGDNTGVGGWVSGTNAATIAKNISTLTTLTYLRVPGNNTLSGSISGLTNLIYLNITGSNTISGSIVGLTSLTYFFVTGSNTISGPLSDLPSGLTLFLCGGVNTFSGSLNDIPSGVTFFQLTGGNTVSNYTSGKDWPDSMNYFYHVPIAGGGLSSTEIDNLIIDLDNGNAWSGSGRTLYLRGTNAARTSASDAAVASLASKSVTVTTTP